MRVGVFVGTQSLDDFVAQVRSAADAGFASAWAPQIFGLDALNALAVAGREVSGIELGTAVVPTYPRHPMTLAIQALTTQAACSGRLTLGIGLSHQVVVENMWGYDFGKPARHMREYLSVLLPLMRDKSIAFVGQTLKAMGQLQVNTDPPPVLLAALAPRMLALAGALADGTITWMTGPKTVGGHVVPHITQAADEAGRSSPRVVVALPVAVTSNEAEARERAANAFVIYGQLPSYRAMLDREGAEGPADVAIVGDAASVRAQVEQVFAQGATDFVAVPFMETERTLALVADIAT
ncbi:MAG TPA: TIGR03564 family F420-dependent LLM class oxidoreductase [Actinomycetota bacterium]|nr:TIGR03564 family F420-dependent LLM class oxidoreductase [Actinomycetota bacterium]